MSGDRDSLLPRRDSLDVNSPDADQGLCDISSTAQIDIDTSSLCLPKGAERTFDIQQRPVTSDSRDGYHEDVLLSDDNPFDISETDYTMDISLQLSRLDPSSIIQAVVFLEDAYSYRSIYHKVHPQQLAVYRKYQSTSYYLFRMLIIFILHIIAFFEYPSSLTITSDLRTEGERIGAPCWLTQVIELLCLLFLLLDNLLRVYWMGTHYFLRHKWDSLAMTFLLISLVDWSVSTGIGCHDFIRFRRFLRPFFIIQHSSIMKKIVHCLFHSFPEIASILLMLAVHLLIFTLFGMLLFPDEFAASKNSTVIPFYPNASTEIPDIISPDENQYFKSFLDSLISLLVLLTTANNPDVTMPAYSRNRFASLFFIVYLFIGLYCFMNMLLAVVYNQFRGYFQTSLQSSLLRRRLGVRASFEVLRRKSPSGVMESADMMGYVGNGIGGGIIQMVVDKIHLPRHIKNDLIRALDGKTNKVFSVRQYRDLFFCLDNEVVRKQVPAISWCENLRWRKLQKTITHRFFLYFGIIVVIANLCVITIQMTFKYDSYFREDYQFLLIINFSFSIYYAVEQFLKLWAFGWRRYLHDRGNIFDAMITTALVITEITCVSYHGFPYIKRRQRIKVSFVLWNIIRIINILIMVRLWKIIPHIKAMSLVAAVLMDLIKNMKAFAGILVVLFYMFAILGIELFHGEIKYKPEYVNKTFKCGTYEQLNYWANNFDDFFAAIIVLWDIMIVNNWHVFLAVFKEKTSPWSYLYFIAWWIMSVIVVLNLFTALIMENFILKWDRRQERQRASSTADNLTFSHHFRDVHSMFKDLLHEPADSELTKLINKHKFMLLDY